MTYAGSKVRRLITSLVGSVTPFRVLVHSASLLSWCLLSCGHSEGLTQKVGVVSRMSSITDLRAGDTLTQSSDIHLSNVLSYLDSGFVEVAISDIDSVWMPSSGCDHESDTSVRYGVWQKEKQALLVDDRSSHRDAAKITPATVRRRSRRISIATRRGTSVVSADTMAADIRGAATTSYTSASRLADSTNYDSLVVDVPRSGVDRSAIRSFIEVLFSSTGIAATIVLVLWLIKRTLRRFLF